MTCTIGTLAVEKKMVLDQFTDVPIPIAITSGGVAVDCTGATLTWEIRRKASDVSALKSFAINWINRALGTAEATMYVDLTCGPTQNDPGSQYFHDLQFIDSAGNKRSAVKGLLVVNRGGVR